MKLILALSMLLLTACSCIQFNNDMQMLTSIKANSPEYLIMWGSVLNAEQNAGTLRPCKNDKGKVGFCIDTVESNKDLVISILPQTYAYHFALSCSQNIDIEGGTFDVQSGKATRFVILHEWFEKERVFSCSVDIQPLRSDRPEPIGAFASFVAIVVDEKYVPAETIRRVGKDLVLGEYSYKAKVWEKDGIEDYTKKTVVRTNATRAMYETYSMRFSYMGF